MKKTLILLLLMGSTNVFAEWTKVDWTDEYINYVDLDSIQINGSKVKMWFLIDYIDHTKVHKFKGAVSSVGSINSGIESTTCFINFT